MEVVGGRSFGNVFKVNQSICFMKRRSHRRPRRHNNPHRNHSKLLKISFFTRRHPLATGVLLIIASLLTFRFSPEIGELIGFEAGFWIFLLALGLGIAGILVLVGWWRNNISNFNVQANLKWKH